MDAASSKLQKIPAHVAIIMDGNGRWAGKRNLPRLEGHSAGARAVRATVEASRKLGIRYLTLFSFSTENWNRSKDEVGGLMALFQHYLQGELANLLETGIRLRAVGDLERLPPLVRASLQSVCDATAGNTGMDLVLALSYGGREEIVSAARRLAAQAVSGAIKPDQIDNQMFESMLWTAGIPNPELLIRTSGEERISNFLLWQLAYTEIIIASELWPDFDEAALKRCLAEFAKRERRYGLTSEQIAQADKDGEISEYIKRFDTASCSAKE